MIGIFFSYMFNKSTYIRKNGYLVSFENRIQDELSLYHDIRTRK